jgi:Flp pilus assembly protein TadB
MTRLILIVSLLVGLAVAFLVGTLLRMLSEWLTWCAVERTQGRPTPFVEQIIPVLRAVAVPVWIRRRWENEAARDRLLHARLPWTVGVYASLRWLTLWLGVLCAVGVGIWRGWDLVGQFLTLVMIAAGAVGPEVWLSQQVERRLLEVNLALPNFLDRLALGLEAGLGFDLAVERVAAHFPGMLGEDLRLAVRQLARGHHREDVLDELTARNPSVDLRAFVAAVKQADRLGTSLAHTLRLQTSLLRAHRRRRVEEVSRRLPILIIFPLVFFFLPALMIVYLAPPILHLFLGR